MKVLAIAAMIGLANVTNAYCAQGEPVQNPKHAVGEIIEMDTPVRAAEEIREVLRLAAQRLVGLEDMPIEFAPVLALLSYSDEFGYDTPLPPTKDIPASEVIRRKRVYWVNCLTLLEKEGPFAAEHAREIEAARGIIKDIEQDDEYIAKVKIDDQIKKGLDAWEPFLASIKDENQRLIERKKTFLKQLIGR